MLTREAKIDYEANSFSGKFVRENRLGPFHSELLEFLQRDVERRCAEEGFDLVTDPQLQMLLKGLTPSSSDESLPLSEIIDNYQHLFGARGPIHIEKILMEAFPLQEFIDLGLTRYYPRIYRGLPRLYHRDHPSQSHIKKNFTHLPSLKKQAVSRALFSLYGKIPVRGRVTLLTWVMGDGWGDYTAAMEVQRILHARLPELELHWVALVQGKMATRLVYPEGSMILLYEGDCQLETFTPEALALLRSSDLILQMPTFYPHTEELLRVLQAMESSDPMPKMECVGEYGFLESSWFHPKSKGYSMGLHFLEKGILVRKACQASWDDVKNEQLLRWRYPESRFYLAYLSTPIGGAIYLHSLLKALEQEERGIDICTPDLAWFVQFVDRQNKAGRPVLEWDVGVESLEVCYEEQTYSISISPRGKKVRLLCPRSITQSDFRALLALSEEWVAVRGNQSFSEALSQGKAFFYDGREHARYLIKDLVAVAENRISSHPTTLSCIRAIAQGFLYNLPVQEEEWVDETFFQPIEEWTSIALQIGLALQDPETVAGYKKLNRVFAEEFTANSFLCHLVQRALSHRKAPDLAALEASGFALFASQSQSFVQFMQTLSEAIAKKGKVWD